MQLLNIFDVIWFIEKAFCCHPVRLGTASWIDVRGNLSVNLSQFSIQCSYIFIVQCSIIRTVISEQFTCGAVPVYALTIQPVVATEKQAVSKKTDSDGDKENCLQAENLSRHPDCEIECYRSSRTRLGPEHENRPGAIFRLCDIVFL